MAIYKDWRIFRRILKRNLALDRTSSSVAAGGELSVKATSEVVLRSDLQSQVLG